MNAQKAIVIRVFVALNLGISFLLRPVNINEHLSVSNIFFLFTAHLSLGCRTDLNNSYTKRLIEMRGELSVLGVVIY